MNLLPFYKQGVIVVALLMLGMHTVHAQVPSPDVFNQFRPKGTAGYEAGPNSQQPAASSIWVKVWRVVRVLILLAGVVAVIAIVDAGFSYTISFGTPEKMEGAKKELFYAIGGLVVVLISYLLVQTIIDTFLFIGQPGETTTPPAAAPPAAPAAPGP